MLTNLRTCAGWALLVAVTLTGCCRCPPESTADPNRNARADDGAPSGETVATIQYLPQNWSPEASLRFYYTSQGSQILPYKWFLLLEQADSTTPFRDNKNLRKFGYLIQGKSDANPDALPVGFVKDDGIDRPWLGLTCAACHTSQINLDNVGYRIDGGPSVTDVQGFLAEVTEALKATRDKDDKFQRFAANVRTDSDANLETDTLKKLLTAIIDRREGYNARNFPPDALPGFGRVDAFGAIVNEVFHHAAKIQEGDPNAKTANTERANAPVSYPCLWDTPQHDVVQWNGVAPNAGLGSLGRNVGEVLGVFGDFEFVGPDRTGYASSVRVRNLLAIEKNLTALWSPQWPASFPQSDAQQIERGKMHFESLKCGDCHNDINRTDEFRRVEAIMRAVGTDSTMAENFSGRSGKTGKLEGAFVSVIGSDLLNSPKLGPDADAKTFLVHAVVGAIEHSGFNAPEDELSKIEFKQRKPNSVGGMAVPAAAGGGVYKARPLNGVWATAPYLHNGSVPTLFDLLKPAKDRPKTFTVGSRQFDAKKVGFRTDAPGMPVFRARNEDGTPVPGNSNAGHEFGAELSDDERWDLVAYLKSL